MFLAREVKLQTREKLSLVVHFVFTELRLKIRSKFLVGIKIVPTKLIIRNLDLIKKFEKEGKYVDLIENVRKH